MSTLLELVDLSAGYGATEVIHGLNMKIEQGSITTLLGSNGAGKTSTLRAICKMIRTRGQIVFEGQRLDGLSTEDIVRLGVAHVPEDRQHLGLIMDFAAWENVAFGYHDAPEYQKNPLFMDNDALRSDTAKKMERFDVRPPIPTLAAKSFSGGNQQKIVVAREIERNPDLLLIGQPTRGVDIGAIEFIHKQIVALRDQGKAILLVSVELDEIRSLSDRIAVMFDGKIMGFRDPETTDERELGLLMAGMTGKGEAA